MVSKPEKIMLGATLLAIASLLTVAVGSVLRNLDYAEACERAGGVAVRSEGATLVCVRLERVTP